MNSQEIKLLIKENSGRPYYVYGLFLPGGNCFYVGKGSGDRVLQHRKHSHSEAVNAIFKRLGNKSPDYEIFNFFAIEKAALLAETDYQKKYLPNGVLANKIIGNERIDIEMYEKPGARQEIIDKCDHLIEKYEIETSLRPNENETRKRWEYFLEFLEEIAKENKEESKKPNIEEQEKESIEKERQALIDKTIKDLEIKRLKAIQDKKENLFSRKIPNRRKSIRAKCLDCSGWSYKEVTNCEFKDCPLFPYRSGQGKQNAKDRAKAIRKYCMWCVNGQKKELLKCPSIDCELWPYRKSKVERPIKIKSLPKKRHIEALSEAET